LVPLAVSWELRVPRRTSALVGASSVAQLEDTYQAVNAPELTAEELTSIEEILGNKPN
jgi:L-glyceraldehyde 3-phosphate reductase